MRFPIVIHTDDGRSYGVTVPDLPGCFSAGDTLDEALDMAEEAIAGHVETLIMEGLRIPKQRPLEIHQANEDFAGGIWGLVDVDLSELKVKMEQVEITLPSPVLRTIDEAAARAKESRSGFLTRAALEMITQEILSQ